jgi:hypothetical protein
VYSVNIANLLVMQSPDILAHEKMHKLAECGITFRYFYKAEIVPLPCSCLPIATGRFDAYYIYLLKEKNISKGTITCASTSLLTVF